MQNQENRIIHLPSLINIRSLEGLQGEGGRKIKKNCIIRSQALTKVSDDDLQRLYDEYQVREVIDLRNDVEKDTAPDRFYPGMKYLFNPIVRSETMGMTHESEQDAKMSVKRFVLVMMGEKDKDIHYMQGLYRHFIDDEFSLNAYQDFIMEFLKPHEGAILFHCTVGKDRAGTGTYFLLKLLGVNDKDITEDYLLTNREVKPDIDKVCSWLKDEMPYPEGCLTYRHLFSALPSYLEALEDEIKKKCGTFAAFAHDRLKLSEEDIKRLQDLYLE